ncbi:outer membrane protein assembly factor BamB [Thermithiobacillus plumbiphilus]|uniref:Outer membrane protein assembly factor BamB n=1 Tax=Thermithiobacillus plumbiphilus TaxID=1729899 RepID=A0ABU9DCJ5_9PROT
MMATSARRALTYSLLLALGLSLGACGGRQASSPEKAGAALSENSVRLHTIWQKRLYGAWRVDNYQPAAPVTDGQRIVTGRNRGEVVVLGADGREVWRKNLKARISASPNIIGDRIYAGTDAGKLYALSLNDGKVIWTSSLSSEVMSSVTAFATGLAVQTNDGKLWALNPQDGKVRWSYTATIPSLSLRGVANPVAADSTIYAGFASGELSALDATDGHVIWQVPVAAPRGRTELERVVDLDATPLIFGDSVIAATYQGRIGAFARGNGAEIWSRDLSVFNPMLLDGNQLYVVDAGDGVQALDASTGAVLWRSEQYKGRGLTGPALVSGKLLLGDNKGNAYVLDPASGRQLGQRRVALTGMQTAPITLGKDALILSREGSLYRIGLNAR